MDILGFIKGELLEIIEFNDDSRDTLSWRFPDEDKAIKNGAQLIVRESQAAQFVYLGQYGDCFGPGKHSLVTDNIPVLTKLKGWKYGFESPFKADVYFVTTRLFTGNKWGTANPIMMRDKDFGVVRLADSDLTQSGVVLGTPSYVSPELLQGAKVDHHADMWSLGVMLFAGGAGDWTKLSNINDPLPQAMRAVRRWPLTRCVVAGPSPSNISAKPFAFYR